MFVNTYGEDTKFIPGLQIIFIPPTPISPAGDTCLFTIFVYIFGKGEEGRGRAMEGLDTPLLHTLRGQPTFHLRSDDFRLLMIIFDN